MRPCGSRTNFLALDVCAPSPGAGADAVARPDEATRPSEATQPDATTPATPGASPDDRTRAGAATGTSAASGPSSADFETVGTGAFTMSFVRSRLNVRIDPEEEILPVAHRAGVRIAANCQEGMCGSCKSVKLAGEVEMHHQGGIRQREIDA